MSNQKLCYENAKKNLVGGCCAGGRHHAIFGQPMFLERANGSKLYDVDGKEYIEYHTSAGTAIYGYNNPRINAAVNKAMSLGSIVHFDTPFHAELAQHISDIIPCAEMVRLGNSGTEVTMAAIRLARAYTKRDIVIKFEGHFHGMHELIWYNHNDKENMDDIGEISNIADTAGVPDSYGSVIKNVEYNDIEALERVVKRYKDQVACIIMEPIAFNCGCYPARKEYLQQVRALCDREGIVMIFDEVITGFRVRPGSAQGYYGVTPDLATLAKALGGGLPIAAVVGKRKIMECFNPVGKVGSSGTTTGALMSVLASIECMKMVKEPEFFDHLEKIGDMLYSGLNDLFKKHRMPGHVRGVGARFGIYFGVEDPEADYNWRKAMECYDSKTNYKFVTEALSNGLYFHNYGTSPVPPHNGFGLAHTADDINITLNKIDDIFARIK